MATLDQVQIARLKFDTEKQADKVTIVDDLHIELSHEDGDSVVTKKKTEVINLTSGQIIDLSYATTVRLVGDSDQCKLIHLIENTEVLEETLYKGVITQVCATLVRVEFTGQKVYLMVQ